MLNKTFSLLDHHLRHLHVPRRRFVEGRGNDLAFDRALHVGDFFGPLVDQQNDQVALGMIGRDRVGDILQQNRLTGPRRRHDQAALAFAERRYDVDHARRQVLDGRVFDFEFQPLGRVERRQVVEVALVLGLLGVFEVDVRDLEEGEIALAVLGRSDLAFDGVAGAKRKTADLRGRDVNVVGAGQVVRFRRPRKPKPSCRTSTTPIAVISVSWVASCFSVANINSCLRKVEAFSTPASSAKVTSSAGDFRFKSSSFICFIEKELHGAPHQGGIGWWEG